MSDGSTFRNMCNETEVSVVQLCIAINKSFSLIQIGWMLMRCKFYNIETCFDQNRNVKLSAEMRMQFGLMVMKCIGYRISYIPMHKYSVILFHSYTM